MKLIYYTLYRLLSKNELNPNPAFSVFISVVFIEVVNAMTIINFVMRSISIKATYATNNIDATLSVICGAFIYIYNYFIYYAKIDRIVDKYKYIATKTVWLCNIGFAVYYIISIVASYLISNMKY